MRGASDQLLPIMPYPIERKLVIGVASSAVFDMREANAVFVREGEEPYRRYQRERLAEPFDRGVAFPFIRRLLNLNNVYPKEEPIEVVVLSKNDPDTGRRFYRSCQSYGLPITRGSFMAGGVPHRYMPAFNVSIFLSPDEKDVKAAMSEGFPAGIVLPGEIAEDDDDLALRVAFDFDGVIADDAAEKVYKENNLDLFHKFEQKNMCEPHAAGPLKDLISKMAFFQKLERKKASQEPGYTPALRIAIVTARNAPSNERVVTTLECWGISPDETHFLGGIEKKRVLEIMKPHIYFDDQKAHLTPAANIIPCVHIPFGFVNELPQVVSKVDVAKPNVTPERTEKPRRPRVSVRRRHVTKIRR